MVWGQEHDVSLRLAEVHNNEKFYLGVKNFDVKIWEWE